MRNARQSRDLAYCLSLLSYANEKSLHKLIECFRFYAEALADKEVFEFFSSILEETRKNAAAAQQPASATAACLFYLISLTELPRMYNMKLKNMTDSCLNCLTYIASEQNVPGEVAPSHEKQSGSAPKGKVDKEREASILVLFYIDRFHTVLSSD